MNSRPTSPADIELAPSTQQDGGPPDRLLSGFPSLAAFISSNANSESFIYKRFDYLAARNLLYLQSELAYLQQKLQDLDEEDHDGLGEQGLEARRCARSWEYFERTKDSDAEQLKRWDLIHRIRQKLQEYQETLLRQSRIAALETPSAKVLEAFNREFYDRDNNPSIAGCSKNIYENNDINIQDLAQLHSTERKDRVSTFLAKHLFRWLQSKRFPDQRHHNPRVSYLRTKRLDLVVDFFFTFLSIVLLLGAILSLYFVENPSWRIAIIVLFTLGFSMCAVFLADGKRLAVFAACAAYAAILVVFVTGNWTPAGAETENKT